jgi:hypothetical protein
VENRQSGETGKKGSLLKRKNACVREGFAYNDARFVSAVYGVLLSLERGAMYAEKLQ